ncbi:MAG: N-acetylmuramoyl-L-alanine amidase-like domain-containing protein [Candidatus Hydrogenedentota bacterium]
MITSILLAIGLAATPIHEQNTTEITHYLEQLQTDNLSFQERMRRVVDDSLGTLYDGGPLGEGPDGKYDADPLVDLKKVDCVTFVEQTVALSVASDYEGMVDVLQTYRYKDGDIGYETRNHFMITDWVRNNPFCKDITESLGVDTKTVTRTISRKDFFELVKAPDVGQDTADEVVALPIVPSASTAASEKKLPDTALIVFVGKVDWLFSLHCGLYLRDETGEGHLIHASSKSGEVVKMSFPDYVKSQGDRYIGFTAYEVLEPEE